MRWGVVVAHLLQLPGRGRSVGEFAAANVEGNVQRSAGVGRRRHPPIMTKAVLVVVMAVKAKERTTDSLMRIWLRHVQMLSG